MKVNVGYGLLVFIVIFSLACGALSSATPTPEATSTPEASPTPKASATPTLRPTSTPRPTATLEPTPAPLGVPVTSDSYEVTVLSARVLKRVYRGNYYWYPYAGYIFTELIVRVSNRSSFDAHVPWQNVYIVEASGASWYPDWGGYQAVASGEKVDGSAISVHDIEDSSETIDFSEDAVLRVIWTITKDEKIILLFGFDDSPNVEVILE